MSRKMRDVLRENVIITARNYVTRGPAWVDPLVNAVTDLDNYEAETVTGTGARAVRGAPETSALSASLAEPIQYSARHRIIRILNRRMERGGNGLTDDEIELASGNSHQTISSARHWLVGAGWVRDTGIRRITRGGRQAVVWELTPNALNQLKGGK